MGMYVWTPRFNKLIFNLLFSELTVVLGTNDLKGNKTTMTYKVEKCKHPDFINVESGNDIMMLKVRITFFLKT